MSTRLKVFIGFICGMLFAIGVPLLILATGAVDWSAAAKPGRIETTLADWALDKSMKSRVSKQSNPFVNQPAAISSGLNHYRENCLFCHGAPGVKRSEAGNGLNPPAPKLQAEDVQQLSDGELFWIIKNGIRFSGMPAFGPTHDNDEIWQIVSFTRHLPHLSAEEEQKLSPATEEAEHHH